MICITVRSSFTVIISNQLSLVNFSSYGFLFLFFSRSFLWQVKPVIVSFGFHTFITFMISQKIVSVIQRFTKTEYFPISLSPSQFSNLRPCLHGVGDQGLVG